MQLWKRTESKYSEKNLGRYEIPTAFPTFKSILVHWYGVVKKRSHGRDTTWRRHLSKAEKKKFQRVQRVMDAYSKLITNGTDLQEAEGRFEQFYKSNNYSLSALSDKFAKNILKTV